MNKFDGLVFNVRTKHGPREENLVSFPWLCNWLSSFHDRHDFRINPAVVFNIYTLWEMVTFKHAGGLYLNSNHYQVDETVEIEIKHSESNSYVEDILNYIDTTPGLKEKRHYLIKNSLHEGFAFNFVDSGIILRLSSLNVWDKVYYYGNISEEKRSSKLLSDIFGNAGWRIRTDPSILNDLKFVQALNKLPEPKVEKDVFTEEHLTKALEQLTLDFGKNGFSRAGLSNIINNASEVIKIANVMLAKDFYDLD